MNEQYIPIVITFITSIFTFILAPVVAAWSIRRQSGADADYKKATAAEALVNTAITLVQTLQQQMASLPELVAKADRLDDCLEELEKTKAALNYWQEKAYNKAQAVTNDVNI